MTDKKRVLVVEDEDYVLAGIKRLLEAMSCEVVVATNYIDGRARLDDGAYALIISDNGMPIGQEQRKHPTAGLEFLAHAARDSRHKGTPLVLHTGDDSDRTKHAAGHIGAQFILKGNLDFAHNIRELLKKKK